jgi:hypothetical protein
MTRSELLTDLQSKAWFVDYVGSIQEEDNKSIPGGTYSTYKIERGHVIAEVSTGVIKVRHVRWVVLDEGEAGEVAYYFEQSADEQVNDGEPVA